MGVESRDAVLDRLEGETDELLKDRLAAEDLLRLEREHRVVTLQWSRNKHEGAMRGA